MNPESQPRRPVLRSSASHHAARRSRQAPQEQLDRSGPKISHARCPKRPRVALDAGRERETGIERMEAETAERMQAQRQLRMTRQPQLPRLSAEAIAIGVRADEARTHARDSARTTMPKQQGSWKLPSSTLLHRPEARQAYDEQELKELALTLTQKCEEFGVLGAVVQINPGPVVTTFEFKPEAGIKYSRIVGLQDDLCLAMRAESILIERVAGKSTVGIQVPNEKRETIWLREVVESPEFSASKSKLTIALGKDINGRLMTTEMNSMPHLLIAGSTGSGKSVAINAFIMSLLYKSTPDQVRLILVDPKRVELTNYDGVPHLYTPIISEPKLASNALRNAVREMEHRLKLLAQKGVRNIDQYNRLFEEGYTPSSVRGRHGRKAAALHRHHRRRIGRPDDGGRRQRRRVDHATGADGARHRHSPCAGHAAAFGRCDHRTDQGELSRRACRSAWRPRSTRAPFWTPTAPSVCWDAATCSTCPAAPRACCACTRPS